MWLKCQTDNWAESATDLSGIIKKKKKLKLKKKQHQVLEALPLLSLLLMWCFADVAETEGHFGDASHLSAALDSTNLTGYFQT